MGYTEIKEEQVTETHVNCENYIIGECSNSQGYWKVNEAAKQLLETKCPRCGGSYVVHEETYTVTYKEYFCNCGKPGEEYCDSYGVYAGIYCSLECCPIDLNWINDGQECLSEDY